jgi:pimeloyl-ACP methyl ester carboxylesterase
MPNVILNDISLYYEIHGSGPPLMMVAGLASDSQSWGPMVEDLARDFLVIVTDNRGVGRSTQTGIGITIPAMADDHLALIDHLGMGAVHLLGHSMGGFIALECAIRCPSRVAGLILAGTGAAASERDRRLFDSWASGLESGMEPRRWLMELFPWLFTRRFLENGDAVEAAVRYALDYPYPQGAGAFRKQVEAIAGFDRSAGLAGIKPPALVIHGREDKLFPAEESLRMFAAIPAIEVSLIEGAAHSIPVEQPEPFAAAIRKFLQR